MGDLNTALQSALKKRDMRQHFVPLYISTYREMTIKLTRLDLKMSVFLNPSFAMRPVLSWLFKLEFHTQLLQ